MKCTRLRCHDAPWNTVPMAFLSPLRASDLVSFTPSGPAGLRRPRERGPERLVFADPDVQTGDFPAYVSPNTASDHYRLQDHPVTDAGHALGRRGTHTGSPWQRNRGHGRHRLHGRADPGDFGRGHPGVSPEGVDQIVDFWEDPRASRPPARPRRGPGRRGGAAKVVPGKRPGPRLGDLQVRLSCGGRQRHWSAANTSGGAAPVRSNGEAPMYAVVSASMSCSYSVSAAVRILSETAVRFSWPSRSSRHL